MIVASISQMHKINHNSLRSFSNLEGYESFEGTHIWNILNVVLQRDGLSQFDMVKVANIVITVWERSSSLYNNIG